MPLTRVRGAHRHVLIPASFSYQGVVPAAPDVVALTHGGGNIESCEVHQCDIDALSGLGLNDPWGTWRPTPRVVCSQAGQEALG